MKTPSYEFAVWWVAVNDNAGNGDTVEEIGNYISTLLVADLFGKPSVAVARDIMRARQKEFGGVQ